MRITKNQNTLLVFTFMAFCIYFDNFTTNWIMALVCLFAEFYFIFKGWGQVL